MSLDFYGTRISRLLDGELSENEEKEVLSHIYSCPECRAEYELFSGMSIDLSKALAKHPFDGHLAERVMMTLQDKKPRLILTARINHFFFAAAACLLIAITLIFAFGVSSDSVVDETATLERLYVTPKNRTHEFDLADVASVKMNEDTRMSLDESGEPLFLALDMGQIFVETVKGRRRDISVRTQEATMTPIGTRFDVRRFISNGVFVTVVSVVEGRVFVENTSGNVIVEAGDQAVVENHHKPRAIKGSALLGAEWAIGKSEPQVAVKKDKNDSSPQNQMPDTSKTDDQPHSDLDNPVNLPDGE